MNFCLPKPRIYQILFDLYFTLSLIIIYLDHTFSKVEYLSHLSVTVCYTVVSMFMLYLQLGSQSDIMHFQWWVAKYWDGLELTFFFYPCITKCTYNCVRDNYCPIRTIVYIIGMYYSKMVTIAEGSLLYQYAQYFDFIAVLGLHNSWTVSLFPIHALALTLQPQN